MNTHKLCDPWPIDLECCPAAKDVDPKRLRRWRVIASTLLWRASGMRWGPSCPITVRPCRRSCLDEGPVSWQAGGQSTGGWTPYIDSGGVWRNRGACGCTTDCSCTELCEVWLPGAPIYNIDEVVEDGELLTRPDLNNGVLGDYRLDAPSRLVRTDGDCWPSCFPAGTLVLTDEGLVPIEEVRPGQRVLTHRNRWRTVLAARQTGVKATVRIQGQGGTLSCTADHQVYARPSSIVKTDGAKVRRRRRLGAADWIAASDLIGNAWATPARIEPLPLVLPEGWSESGLPDNFWWFVGRWVGDGWTDSSARSSRVIICCGAHEAEELRRALKATGWDWTETADRKDTYEDVPRFRFSNPSLYAWLRAQFGTSAETKSLPSWLLGAPEAVRRQFLEGYVGADGWRGTSHNGRGRQFTSTHTVSRRLALGTRLIAASLGYSPTIYEGRAGGPHRARTYRVNWPEVLPGEPYSQAELDGNHLWNRVRKIEESPSAAPVYDLEVDEDHSFVADGFVVHNCQDMTAPCGAPGTFCVTYRTGLRLDAFAIAAVSEVVCHLLKGCKTAGDCGCNIPANARRVSRQGVDIDMGDPAELQAGGLLGLPIADAWIKAVNPDGLHSASRVYSPDLRRPRVTTWP